MKRLIPFLSTAVVLLFVLGCHSGMKRTGYKMTDDQRPANLRNCHIAIQCYPMFRTDSVTVVGRISSYDTGLSVTCDEAYVLDIFCKEACALGADIVVIKEEKHPDDWSTCYRAKAEFVRFKDRAQAKNVTSDSKFAPDLIIARSEQSKQRTRERIYDAVWSGILGGITAGAINAASH